MHLSFNAPPKDFSEVGGKNNYKHLHNISGESPRDWFAATFVGWLGFSSDVPADFGKSTWMFCSGAETHPTVGAS